MTKIKFNKQALTYEQQLDQLKARGLLINDEDKALFLLENISYYRLSGYWYPLLADKKKHIFKNNSTFDTAFNIYCFDKELRKLVLSNLEKIEIAIRAKMIYILSHSYGAFWYQNQQLFRNQNSHTKTLDKIKEEFDRSDEEFIFAFKKNYIESLPPSWIILEITSFGSLSKLYSNLISCKEKRDIAHYFGLSDSVFGSWLHSIVYLRNICAHHTRLWNRVMQINPMIPKKHLFAWVNTPPQNNRTYMMLCLIKYLLCNVHPSNKFKNDIIKLFNTYSNISPFAMHFPLDWEKEPLWK